MDKFFSFKRFVTFGLGLGIFMSAASGFAQSTVGNLTGPTVVNAQDLVTINVKDSSSARTTTIKIDDNGYVTGNIKHLSIQGGTTANESAIAVGGGKFVVNADGSVNTQSTVTTTGKIATSNDVQGKDVIATGVVRGGNNTTPNNTTLAADFKGSVSIVGKTNVSGDLSVTNAKLTATGNVELGQAGTVTTVNGSRIDINTTTTNINSAAATNINSLNTNTKTLNATGNVNSTGTVTGKQGLQAGNNNEFAVSNTGNVQAKGVTADNISTTGGKVNINGANGNIAVTQGGKILAGTATIDSANGNITTLGQTDTNKLIVRNGAQITSGGLNMTNGKITNLATGTANSDAVNVGQMNNSIANARTEAITAAAADATTKANTAKSEAIATAASDATTKANNALTSAKEYTDGEITALTTTVNDNATIAANATAAVQTNLNDYKTTNDAAVALKADKTTVDALTTTVNNNATAAANATTAVQTNLDNEVIRAKAAEKDLDDRKADKTALDAEESARIDGDKKTLQQANSYTDTTVKTEADARIAGDAALGAAIGAVDARLTTEVTRLDGRIDGVSAALGTESAERKSEIKRVDGRIDTEAKTRADADIALNKRIDVESTERKQDVFNLNNRVDQEIVDRIEGDRQTLEEANAHTNNVVSAERDRAMAAEAGLNRHINGLGAMTMAANAVAHTANPGDKKTSVGVGVGSYGGETAVAIGATHTRHIEVDVEGKKRPVIVRYGATLSKSRASRTGFGVGASFSF